MIQQRNISKLANRLYMEACDRVGKKLALRIQETTIERDYCLAWLLCSMTAHPVLSEALAFKGGTALRRVHFGEYRFSEDLDFTLMRDLTLDAIFSAFDEVFDKLYEESEIKISSVGRRTHSTHQERYLLLQLQGAAPRRESSQSGRHPRRKPWFSHWKENQCSAPTTNSLICQATSCYRSTRSRKIAVEKTLAVTDGARREPRDLYDLWYISNEGHVPHCEDLIDGLNKKLMSREGPFR